MIDYRAEEYRKRQLSQWEFEPQGAFNVFRHVSSGLSKATCHFIFYRNNELVTKDAPEAEKQFLRDIEPRLS